MPVFSSNSDIPRPASQWLDAETVPVRIALPDLHQRTGNGLPAALRHAAVDEQQVLADRQRRAAERVADAVAAYPFNSQVVTTGDDGTNGGLGKAGDAGKVSCNSCHNLSMGGTDNLKTSVGHGWQPGKLNAQAYDSEVADLVGFMEWMSEPVKNKRQQLGVWVLLFLAVLVLLTWRLNASFWKEVK